MVVVACFVWEVSMKLRKEYGKLVKQLEIKKVLGIN